MFRCSLARLCPRRPISITSLNSLSPTPACTWTIRTSPSSSLFFSTSSNPRIGETVSADDGPETDVPSSKKIKVSDTILGQQFLAPSAGGISPTTGPKEDPHALLVRAGYIRQAHAGVFHLLPLALKVQRRVEAGLQRTMHNIDASEVSLSSISSETLWKRSGRIEQPLKDGQHEFMTIQDRRKSGFILSPTHEEEITSLVSEMTNSYKDFPLRLFQISRKYRDELRPRQGLLRTKEFTMKDLYTFDTTEKAALATYQLVRAEYRRFFEALGVPYVEVEASSGNMGGSLSHEYHFLSPLGEDTIIVCESCGFAANEEILPKKDESQDKHQCPRCTGTKISTHRAIEIGHTFHLGTRYTEPLGVSTILPMTAQASTTSSTELKTEASDANAQSNSTSRVPLQMGCHGIGVSRLIGAVAAMTADEKGLSWPPLMAPSQVVVVFDGSSPPSNPDFPGMMNDYQHFSDRLAGIYYRGAWGKGPGVSIVFDDRDKPLPWKLKDADLTGYPVIIVVGKSFKQSGKYEIQCRSSPQLTVTSDALATSLVDVLNELTPRATEHANAWFLGPSCVKFLTKEQLTAWKSKRDPNYDPDKRKDRKSPTRDGGKENAATLMKPTPPLAQNLGTKEKSQVIAKSDNAFKITRPRITCRVCGKQHLGECRGTLSKHLSDEVRAGPEAKKFARSNALHEARTLEVSPASRERFPLHKQERSPLHKTDSPLHKQERYPLHWKQERYTEALNDRHAVQHNSTMSAIPEQPKQFPSPVDPESPHLGIRGLMRTLERGQTQRNSTLRENSPQEDAIRELFQGTAREESQATIDSAAKDRMYEAPPPPSPPTSAPVQQQPAPSHAPGLSHAHLLERVALLERLMALKAEEDMLKKQGGK